VEEGLRVELSQMPHVNTLTTREAAMMPPLVLAYLGDVVYELYIRTHIVTHSKASVHKLHVGAVRYVNAKAQSAVIKKVMDRLSEEEADIVRRGRNAKPGKVPKNTDVAEYAYSTAFEALIGYLYVSGQQERMYEILRWVIEET